MLRNKKTFSNGECWFHYWLESSRNYICTYLCGYYCITFILKNVSVSAGCYNRVWLLPVVGNLWNRGPCLYVKHVYIIFIIYSCKKFQRFWGTKSYPHCNKTLIGFWIQILLLTSIYYKRFFNAFDDFTNFM